MGGSFVTNLYYVFSGVASFCGTQGKILFFGWLLNQFCGVFLKTLIENQKKERKTTVRSACLCYFQITFSSKHIPDPKKRPLSIVHSIHFICTLNCILKFFFASKTMFLQTTVNDGKWLVQFFFLVRSIWHPVDHVPLPL